MIDKIKNLTDFLNELDTQERNKCGRFINQNTPSDDEFEHGFFDYKITTTKKKMDKK